VPAAARARRASVVSGKLPPGVSVYDALGRRSQGLKPGVYFTRGAGRTDKALLVR